MMSAIATQPKTRSSSKRMSSSSVARVMTPIPEHQQQPFVATRQQKPKVKTAKREDDIPLALLAYKKGYTTIHPTTIVPEEKRHIHLTTTTTNTGTNRSRESSTSNRSILKQQKNTTDRQHRDNKSNREIMMTMAAMSNKSQNTKKKNGRNNKSKTIPSLSSLSPPSSSSTFSSFSSSPSSPSSSHPPSLLPTKPHVDRPDKRQTQPLTKHNELISTKLKRWFSLHRISNKIKSF